MILKILNYPAMSFHIRNFAAIGTYGVSQDDTLHPSLTWDASFFTAELLLLGWAHVLTYLRGCSKLFGLC